jgi:hypothetical protein
VSHDVRTHTRRVNGKTVTVRRHQQDDDAAQRKRDNFERRVLRDRQQAAHPDAYPATRRAPGERKRRKKTGWQRAKGHAKKARRLWRRHKARAAAHGLAALGCAAGHATRRGAAGARKTWRKWRMNRRTGK